MRLIDADALIEDIKKQKSGNDAHCRICLDAMAEMVEEQPTAYDVEKVVSDVEEYANSKICWKHEGCPYQDNSKVLCENCGALGALEIVRKGGVE